MDPATRREQILKAATEVFAERGYHATRVSDIQDRAGVARGTVYLYFASKRAVFDALVERMFGRLLESVAPIDVTSDVPPHDQLRGNLRAVLRVLGQERRLARILFHEAVGLDRELDARLAESWGQLTTFLEESLATGERIGFLRPTDRRIAARAIIGMVKEMLHPGAPDAPPEDPAALTDTVLDLVLVGIRRQP